MLPLALTLGEPAGIGPDLSLALWAKRKRQEVPPFILVGDPALLAARADQLRLTVDIAECQPREAVRRFAGGLPVLPLGIAATAAPGRPDASSAACARSSIERAVALVMGGEAAALVTNPIAKSVMAEAGLPYPGHTEFLAHLAKQRGARVTRPVMLIWSEELCVIPVTIHVPLAQVPQLLNADLIVETGRIAARELARRFGIARPRLAVCGLNPHAGEGGAFGREEETVIRPAIERLRSEGIAVSGPHAADTLFHREARAHYDVALGMYHDQVLAPVKTIAFERAVNVTLGLPFIRTSPDHGTAFDLASTGKANPTSLLCALQLAQRLAAEAPAPAA